MSKNICILPILRHHTHFFVKKLKKIPNCQFCLFFDIFIKNAKIKKSDSQNPKKWLSCIIKLEIFGRSIFFSNSSLFSNSSFNLLWQILLKWWKILLSIWEPRNFIFFFQNYYLYFLLSIFFQFEKHETLFSSFSLLLIWEAGIFIFFF